MSLEIDPQFVDVDLAVEAKRLGIGAGFAATAQRFGAFQSRLCGAYGDSFTVLPEAERTALIEKLDQGDGLEFLVKWILNQKNEGSCVGNATTQAVQVLSAKQWGESRAVPLSAISMYKQIGSGPMSGANVEDAMDKVLSTGILPLDTPENRARFGDKVMPPTGFYTAFPADWQRVAKEFRADKVAIIRSVEEAEQAGINGHPIVVGRAGHSILYVRPTLKQGRGFLYANSWGDWGFAAGGLPSGFGLDTAGMVRSACQWAFAILSVTTPDYILAA